MTREQARAILAHLDLIRHYAEGGDVGHRMHNCKGEFLYTAPARGICLSNLRADSTSYVRVKPRYVWDTAICSPVRHMRAWPERIGEHEIISEDAK